MSTLLRRGAKRAVAAAQLVDPSRLGLPPRRREVGSTAFVAVYRHRHARRLARLLQQLGPETVVRLWCLDEPAESLERWTVGQGPGTRFALLNRLIATVPESSRRDGLIVSDDDYAFRVGGLRQLVTLGRAFGLDVWQPAHDRTSFANFAFVRRRRGAVLRRTSFVEQGPVLVLSARAQSVFLPFREDIGMGWGVEIGWSRSASEHGLELGVADALLIRHLPPVGGYDRETEAAQLRLLLDEAGLAKVDELQQEHARIGPVRARQVLRRGPAPVAPPPDA